MDIGSINIRSISPSNEYSRQISVRMDWLALLAVQGTLKSLLQHHRSKASVLRPSAFFIVQFSYSYTTTGKTIALTRQTFVGKGMSLLLNMLSRLVIAFLPRRKHLLVSWLQSPSATKVPPQSVHYQSSVPSFCWEGQRNRECQIKYVLQMSFDLLRNSGEISRLCLNTNSCPCFGF